MKLINIVLACTLALSSVACGGGDDSGSGGDGDGDGDGVTADNVEDGCIRMCERANECPDGEQQECELQCGLITGAADLAGCSAEWVDLIQCANDNEDVACDEETTVCDAPAEAFETCIDIFDDSI